MSLLTPKQLSERACVSQFTVYALLNAGKLTGFRVGCRGRRKWLVKWEDWEAFLATCKVSEWPDEVRLTHIR